MFLVWFSIIELDRCWSRKHISFSNVSLFDKDNFLFVNKLCLLMSFPIWEMTIISCHRHPDKSSGIQSISSKAKQTRRISRRFLVCFFLNNISDDRKREKERKQTKFWRLFFWAKHKGRSARLIPLTHRERARGRNLTKKKKKKEKERHTSSLWNECINHGK